MSQSQFKNTLVTARKAARLFGAQVWMLKIESVRKDRIKIRCNDVNKFVLCHSIFIHTDRDRELDYELGDKEDSPGFFFSSEFVTFVGLVINHLHVPIYASIKHGQQLSKSSAGENHEKPPNWDANKPSD